MAMCLLALCLAFTCVGSAAAAMSIPAVCLRAATTLCHGSETSALRCLVTKVRSGDASVPEECSNALKQQLPTLQQQQQQKGGSRKQSLMRLLTEVPTFACHKRPTVAAKLRAPLAALEAHNSAPAAASVPRGAQLSASAVHAAQPTSPSA
eukprot:CAMPEP_0197686262 /NCGR_PEP_ID=MMETSP1338-20131121/102224_1 /TAXON_ID=43686 ORGANISM="Pelagodinium beii, Strain RCC1491" /NCGR_SAMPLE_ID=MMETSP1338 /ASSEMBLY_ACC=CAM_ASM_000754 /LENGTH=150 /DNA_ID=CAMNT_0043268175 /DNA_START=25 /DNA_END=474 /DNA_ORIENTATION=+